MISKTAKVTDRFHFPLGVAQGQLEAGVGGESVD